MTRSAQSPTGPHWDAAIIGGGPAGCSAAIKLAESGLKVILFEAKTYPHDKLCGEFLSPECPGLLTELGLARWLVEVNPVQIQKVVLTAPDQTAWEGCLPAPALGVSRRLLDAALAEQAQRAGVEVRQVSPVSRISGSLAEGFTLEVGQPGSLEEVSARAVISAHGKRGALDRVLGRQFIEQPQPFVAIKAHFTGPRIPGRIELHAFPGGYCGLSEIENDARVVCLLVQEPVFQARGGRGPEAIDRFIQWMCGQNLYLKSWMQWAERIHERWISIAQVPFVPKPAISHDVLMAGDSAGLVAPLAGNGISMALSGGMLAAAHLARFLMGDQSAQDLRQAYPAGWRKRYARRLQWGRTLQPMMFNPRAASLVLKALNVFPGLGQYFIQQTRDPVH